MRVNSRQFFSDIVICQKQLFLTWELVFELIHELRKLLEIQQEHASSKHPQTVDVVERSHCALERILKLNTNEQWKDWFKYVQLATFIHNTSLSFSDGLWSYSSFPRA